jgi:hypothetical protein
MKFEELIEKLKLYGVPNSFYSLYGKDRIDTFVLERLGHVWNFYYFDERGNRDSEKQFYNVSLACDYIYDTITKSYKLEKKYNKL